MEVSNYLEHLDEDAEQMTIVNFMSSGKMSWLEHVLDLPTGWWRGKSNSLPLFAEIKNMIYAKKDYRGKAARAPRQGEAALAITVRGRTLLVQNLPHLVRLALPGPVPDQVATLQWFLDQIREDIKDRPAAQTTWSSSVLR